MVCPQCGANTKVGARCKRKTCRWAPKCFSHTSVSIGSSGVSGRGLFARKPIRKNEIVADYTFGEPITPATYHSKRQAGTATHVAFINKQHYDASDSSTTVAGMANRAPKGKRNNLQLTKTGKLKASRAVPEGRELFLSYGPAFRI